MYNNYTSNAIHFLHISIAQQTSRFNFFVLLFKYKLCYLNLGPIAKSYSSCDIRAPQKVLIGCEILITLNGAFYSLESKIVPRLSRDVTGAKKRNLDSSETKRAWSLSLYKQYSLLFYNFSPESHQMNVTNKEKLQILYVCSSAVTRLWRIIKAEPLFFNNCILQKLRVAMTKQKCKISRLDRASIETPFAKNWPTILPKKCLQIKFVSAKFIT